MNNNNNNKKNSSDMIDIQDKIGYVDTGPTVQTNGQYQPVATSTSAHLVIKEPKPQRQLNIPESKRPIPEIKRPIEQKKEPMNKKPMTYTEPIESSSTPRIEKRVSYEERYIPREELKEMMVHKLYELADIINSLNIEDSPRPTPSKSDPQIRRRPSKGKNSSPENYRHTFNKSAEEPIYRHRPYYHNYYDHYSQPLPQQQQDIIYDDDLDYYTPNDVYYQPQQPPPQQQQRYLPRQRRKSYGNLRDEEPRLIRKTSRNNLARHYRPPPPPVNYDPRYDTYPQDMIPPTSRYHHPPSYYQAYSPDEFY